MKKSTLPNLLSFWITIFFPCFIFAQDTLYVDASATGANDGTSWENAYTKVSSALNNNAGYGDQVWVAKGTYYPTSGSNRAIPLNLANGVKLYGGFEGGETSIDQRDWEANPTIFSGDIGIVGDSTDNSYTVLICNGADSTTLLDGIIVEKGNANGDPDISDFFVNGGGIYLIGEIGTPEARPLIRNCIIRNNIAAGRGGGVYVDSKAGQWCGFEFQNCSFLDNEAQNGGGIAIFNTTVSKESAFIGCRFESNYANPRGGGIYFLTYQGSKGLNIQNCIFNKNICLVDGGGIYWENVNSKPLTLSIYESTFMNCATGGGTGSGGEGAALGLFDVTFLNIAALTLEKSFFENNLGRTMSSFGFTLITNNCIFSKSIGGVLRSASSEGVFNNCLFSNSSASIGGVLSSGASKEVFNNCVFFNSSASIGGVLRSNGGSEGVFNSCSFLTFFATNSGAFIYSGQYTLNNCIVIENHPSGIPSDNIFENTNVTINHSLTDLPNCTSLGSDVTCGPGMLYGIDPLFVDPANGDFRLQACSPARNAGSNDLIPPGITTDFDGNPRIEEGTVDMGAFESRPFQIQLQQVQHVNCFGDSTGRISLEMESGCAPFSVAVNDQMLSFDSVGIELDSLPAGDYTLLATDAQGRSDTLTVAINQPPLLQLNVNPFPVSCATAQWGFAMGMASGGSPAYQWNWSDGTQMPVADSLQAGNYSVTITDSVGCTQSDSFTIEIDGQLGVKMDQTHVSCFGLEDGTASANPSGGLGPFSWQWQNDEDTETITDLPPGNYAVTVTDALGCVFEGDTDVFQPDSLFAEIELQPVACFGQNSGSLNITGIGGLAPYQINWEADSLDAVFLQEQLSSGAYIFTLTDDNGCHFTDSAFVSQPDSLITLSTVTPASCWMASNGAITLSAEGGTTPYDYQWEPGIYNGQSELIGLSAGDYPFTLTDANGCMVTDSLTVLQPDSLFADAAIEDVQCFGDTNGSISITPQGGTGPYSYDWNPDIWDGMNVLEELAGASYALTLTDNKGCTATQEFVVATPDSLWIASMVDNVRCAGGADGFIQVSPQGGTMPYQLSWEPAIFGGQTILEDLAEGLYILTTVDAQQCMRTDSFHLTAPDSIMVQASIEQATSPQNADGSISLDQVMGGTPPYFYNWSTGSQSPNGIESLLPGAYFLTITDARDCEQVFAFEVDFMVANQGPGKDVGIDLYPNPAKTAIEVVFSAPRSGHWQLYDAQGRLLNSQSFGLQKQLTLTREDLAAGIYWLRFYFQGEKEGASVKVIWVD